MEHTGWIFIKIFISVFSKIYRQYSRFFSNLTKITCVLHEYLIIFMTISLLVLFKIRNVSDKNFRENKTRILYKKALFLIRPFMRKCGKI